MAKSVNAGAFTADLTRGDCDRLLEYVKQLGSLDDGYRYASSTRAGHVRYDYMEPSVFNAPLAFPELLRSRFMQIMSFGESDDQAAMMMEPVGGMDRIVTAFMARVGPLVRTHAQVQAIHLTGDGVDVRYRHKGENRTVHADFCLNCIPIQLLAGIENNFPVEYSRPFTAITRGKLFKIGLQMKERFWENDGIYGGISWTMQDIAQVWYPAHGIHRKKGVVLGAYATTEEVGEKFARMPHAARIEAAIAQGEKIHPGYGKYVEGAVSISWARMNHMCGCAVRWTPELQAQYFKTVQAPAGNHYLLGDQVSYHPGWQESAVHSAFHAIADIDRRVRAGAPQLVAS
jgi:monoamine oxidase